MLNELSNQNTLILLRNMGTVNQWQNVIYREAFLQLITKMRVEFAIY